jgi:hypothetical protein
MKRLQDAGDLLLASENGEFERGPYAAVLSEEKGVGRMWKTAAITRTLEFFVSDRQPLLWTLKAPEAIFMDQRQLFESMIAAAEFLPPEEWETKVVEPWIDYTLHGPWQAEGPGVYASAQAQPTFILLSVEPTTFSLEKLQPSILESMRQSFHLKPGFTERSVLGAWRQYDALHYAIDGISFESGDRVNARASWLVGQRRLFNLFVRGTTPEFIDKLATGLLESFQPSP